VPLTPIDVEQVLFRRAFRGYDVDEVDAFLDRVQGELARLLSSPPAVAAEEPAPTQEGQEAALRTLLLAQRTADQAVAEAREEAEQIRSAAGEQATATVATAREQAEALLSASRAEAAQVDEKISQRLEEALGDLDRRRSRLQADIDELRAFEREYRTRLRAYVEGQLRELAGGTGPDDDGVGVPVGASGAAVGRTAALRAVPGSGPERTVPATRPAEHVEALDPAATAERLEMPRLCAPAVHVHSP
jgi:DivIVA domain-containing protein